MWVVVVTRGGFFAGYSSRRVQSPSSKSNDTLSGISSIEPSKHSSSSHSLASVRPFLALPFWEGLCQGCITEPSSPSPAIFPADDSKVRLCHSGSRRSQRTDLRHSAHAHKQSDYVPVCAFKKRMSVQVEKVMPSECGLRGATELPSQ